MSNFKRTVRVVIEKEIEVEFMPSMLGDMTAEQFLSEFNESLFEVRSLDDVAMYAARMAAYFGGGFNHDGIGLLDTVSATYPRVPDVKYRVLSDDAETEII